MLAGRLIVVLAILTAGAGGLPLRAGTTDQTRAVLVLLTGQAGTPAANLFLDGFRKSLLSDSTLRIGLVAEHISLSSFPTPESRASMVRYLEAKYAGQRFDLLVAWGIDPLRFLAENRSRLWPGTKAIACMMGDLDSAIAIPPDFACVFIDFDFRGTAALIRRLHPDARHIVLVGGYAAEDQRNIELARDACLKTFGRIDIIERAEPTAPEMMARLQQVPDHSVVLLGTILADRDGKPVVGADWVPTGVRATKAPIYGILAHLVPLGIVGGSVTDIEDVGAEVAKRADEELHGRPGGRTGSSRTIIASPEFNAREMKRWGIDESLLPAGSIVRFRPPSFWEEYRWPILGTLGLLLVLAVSTFVLAIERKYRVQAQRRLEEQLRNEEKRLGIESLVAELSLPLIRCPPEALTDQITAALRQIAKLLEYDRASFFEIPQGSAALHVIAAVGQPEGLGIVPGATVALPWVVKRLTAGESVIFDSMTEDLPEEAREEHAFAVRAGLLSALMIPLEDVSGTLSVVSFGAASKHVLWSSEIVNRLKIIGLVLSGIVRDRRTEARLQEALAEVTSLKQKLEAENVYLREAAAVKVTPEEIVARSPAMQSVLTAVERVAPTDATVLMMGETGSGKEVLASAIHRLSKRHEKTMVTLNCAALPPSLFEAELFGREKGAYTGALTRQAGRFELAHGSTLFLDEIGDLNHDLQVKLLRVLERGELQRVGGTQTIKVDVRLIAATNRDLPAAVHAGTFREDLFYRLNVFPISVPPLRLRQEDIPMLAWTFAKQYAQTLGRPIERIPQATMEMLQQYSWPGNVRELRNVIERAMILGDSSTLHVSLPAPSTQARTADETLDEAERKLILDALERARWRIRGSGGAAELLGLKPSTLEHRMKRHGLKRRS